MTDRHAVVLLSGGMDSATVLAIARRDGFTCHTLAFDYGQRHEAELAAAAAIAAAAGVSSHRVLRLDIGAFGGSALTDASLELPTAGGEGIPVTYVPARNTVFLACGLALAEAVGARSILIGVNAVDYSGYPDCRPAFVEAFERLANLATKVGVEGAHISIEAPLLHSSKAEIVRLGAELGVDHSMTVSCYDADEEGKACGACDACVLRREGFRSAGVADPTRYR